VINRTATSCLKDITLPLMWGPFFGEKRIRLAKRPPLVEGARCLRDATFFGKKRKHQNTTQAPQRVQQEQQQPAAGYIYITFPGFSIAAEFAYNPRHKVVLAPTEGLATRLVIRLVDAILLLTLQALLEG
jgi:hypothetical protein